jgi:hypothetical protein
VCESGAIGYDAAMEAVLPPGTASGAGFELTRVRQFTVFLENRVGRLMALLRALEEDGQHLHALAIEESADAALVRLIVSDPEHAKPDLKRRGFSLSTTEVLCVELPVRNSMPLQAVCQALLAAELNLHYTYPMLKGISGPAVVVYVDDPTLACRLLLRKGFRVLSEGDLGRPKEQDEMVDGD